VAAGSAPAGSRPAGWRIAVGNDVVDLADPETRLEGLHPRFAARVFTAAERSLLEACADRQRLHWALWAAKESTYKALKQLEPTLAFSPRQLEVALEAEAPLGNGCTAGIVTCGDLAVDVGVRLGDGSVHAIARVPRSAGLRVLSAVEPAGSDAGSAVRRLATSAIGAALDLDAAGLRISGRPPRVEHRGSPLDVAVSLSHHGRFVAFAAALPAHLAGSAPRVRVSIE
jgi:phosphopantetheinyl transferase